MRVYIMTDLEGVAGVLDHENWCRPESRYYELAKEFLTLEVNAAVDGFFQAGAEYILVADGHGPGAINPKLLDKRVELLRGWGKGYPLGMEEGFDFAAWVGQHAKSRTEYSHLAHTQGFVYFDLLINGVSIGEFGQLAFCASQLGVRCILACGELAFTKEAQDLFPGIETVSVKRGTRAGKGDNLDAASYARKNLGAIHLHPERARELIREGARRALERAKVESFGLYPLKPPFTRVAILRRRDEQPMRYSVQSHPTDVIELMNMPYDWKPLESEEQLQRLLKGEV